MAEKHRFWDKTVKQGKTAAMAVTTYLLMALTIVGQICALIFSKNERYFPDSAALAQFISCCAQIVAGLYGITLAGRSGPEGSAVEFIALYDQIERQCETMLPAQVLARLRESKSNHFSYTIELLREQKLVPDPVIAELTRLYSYYACVVNCEPLSVKQEMCDRAARVRVSLQQPEQQKTQASSFAERLQQGRMLER